MEPAIAIAGLWIVFGGTHVGLATRPVRGALVRRLGEGGFLALFSAVAAVSFAVLVRTYAGLRHAGAPGLDLAAVPWMRAPLVVAVVAGVVLVVASFASYGASPYAPFGAGHDGRVRGFEAVTRHGFFAGVALVAGAHALLAPHLVGTVAFGGLALLAVLGARHQDAKLLALRGEPYARYLAATSAVPFAAVAAGRQHLVLRELPWVHLAAGVAVAIGLRRVHETLFAADGAWIIGIALATAVFATADGWRRGRRERRVAASAIHAAR